MVTGSTDGGAIMRGKLAAAVLAAGLLVAAGCSDDSNGGGGTEEVCEDINQVVDPLDAELTSALQAAGTAAATGDEAALAEAAVTLDNVIGEVTTALRDGADRAEDQEFSSSLQTFADELESLGEVVISGEQLDLTALGEAADRVEGYCTTG
jgi:hypothetical protein